MSNTGQEELMEVSLLLQLVILSPIMKSIDRDRCTPLLLKN